MTSSRCTCTPTRRGSASTTRTSPCSEAFTPTTHTRLSGKPAVCFDFVFVVIFFQVRCFVNVCHQIFAALEKCRTVPFCAVLSGGRSPDDGSRQANDCPRKDFLPSFPLLRPFLLPSFMPSCLLPCASSKIPDYAGRGFCWRPPNPSDARLALPNPADAAILLDQYRLKTQDQD